MQPGQVNDMLTVMASYQPVRCPERNPLGRDHAELYPYCHQFGGGHPVIGMERPVSHIGMVPDILGASQGINLLLGAGAQAGGLPRRFRSSVASLPAGRVGLPSGRPCCSPLVVLVEPVASSPRRSIVLAASAESRPRRYAVASRALSTSAPTQGIGTCRGTGREQGTANIAGVRAGHRLSSWP
jgi:hypothetical protein